jgi:hypothetical protein
MKHIHTFENFLNEAEAVGTLKSAALDFVEGKGKATWKEIHSFLMKNKGFDPTDYGNRGNMSSYFSGSGYAIASAEDAKSGRSAKTHGLLMVPTLKDPRYLDKQDDGTYVVKVWDKKNKIAQ